MPNKPKGPIKLTRFIPLLTVLFFCSTAKAVPIDPPFFDHTVRTESFSVVLNMSKGVDYTLSFALQDTGSANPGPDLFQVYAFGYVVYTQLAGSFGFTTFTFNIAGPAVSAPNDLYFDVVPNGPFTYRDIYFGPTAPVPDSLAGLWLVLPVVLMFTLRSILGKCR